jgi:hypothetical protein
MKPQLQSAFDAEIAAAATATQHPSRMHHLARAHILGQRYTWAHVRVHVLMLKAGMQVGDAREVVGQIIRVVAASLFSRIWVPAGNPGLASINAMKPMPVPEDLRGLM